MTRISRVPAIALVTISSLLLPIAPARGHVTAAAFFGVVQITPPAAERKQGNPTDHLPTDMDVLTHFNDYQGWKASNPVVSTDGRYIAFQIARTTDPSGVGYGIMLMRLNP